MLSVPQRYRQTDRRTDGRTTYDSNTALALRASRGKNTYNLEALDGQTLSLTVFLGQQETTMNY